MPFGQVVIGPPGSGKTTYCLGVAEILKAIKRDVCIVNLDPANDELPYDCDVDIAELVCVDNVQEELGLGPNGAMVYCMEYLEQNIDWLKEQLQCHIAANKYFLFDCPGQAELYTCHSSYKNIIGEITDRWHFNLTAVQLMDAHLVLNPYKYLSALLSCLGSMLHLSLPHVNVITKVDLIEQLADSDGPDLEQLADIGYLQRVLAVDESSGEFSRRFSGLSASLCEVIEDYGLLRLEPLAIQQKESVLHVLEIVDRANGFYLSGLQGRKQPYATENLEAEIGGLNISNKEIWSDAETRRRD